MRGHEGPTKQCNKCGIEKPIEDFYKRSRKGGPSYPLPRCKPCAIEDGVEHRHANLKRHAVAAKKWRDENPERNLNIRMRRYGIDAAIYRRLENEQNGVCAICKGPPNNKGGWLAVDHDHKTGRVRALLCNGCNSGLGLFGDDPAMLERAITYLKKYTVA